MYEWEVNIFFWGELVRVIFSKYSVISTDLFWKLKVTFELLTISMTYHFIRRFYWIKSLSLLIFIAINWRDFSLIIDFFLTIRSYYSRVHNLNWTQIDTSGFSQEGKTFPMRFYGIFPMKLPPKCVHIFCQATKR